jgi:hypothetical protein
MKCERCGWPTSLWQRDLFSGLCGKCQQIDKSMPGADAQIAVLKALVAHVVDRLNQGETPETVQGMMSSNGFDPQTASTVIASAIAERERKYPKITCPVCGAFMTPGKASIRPSMAGVAVDALSVLGGGITALPESLYFRKTEGADQIEIDTHRASHYCYSCETFAIVGKHSSEEKRGQ